MFSFRTQDLFSGVVTFGCFRNVDRHIHAYVGESNNYVSMEYEV